MSSNQREIQRRDKRAQKERKVKRIIWIVLITIIVILAIMKIFEINVNSVKERFIDEDGKFNISESVDNTNFPYYLDASENVSVKNINNKLGIMTPTTFTVLDSADAEVEYSFDHGYSNPVIEYSGIYTLIYDQGQNNYRLDTTTSSVYAETMDNTILCCDVTKSGTAAIATTSTKKLCEVNVFTKALKNLCTVEISEGYVIDIAISDNASKVACAVVNSESANLYTQIYVYDTKSGKELSVVDLPQGSVAELKYSGRNLIVIGDTYMGVVKGSSYKPVYNQGDIFTVSYSFTPSGDLVLAYTEYNNATENIIAYIKSSGRVKSEIGFDGAIKCISASSNIVSILTGNSITGVVLSSGEIKENIEVDDSVKTICRIGSTVYIQRQSVIDRCDSNDS